MPFQTGGHISIFAHIVFENGITPGRVSDEGCESSNRISDVNLNCGFVFLGFKRNFYWMDQQRCISGR